MYKHVIMCVVLRHCSMIALAINDVLNVDFADDLIFCLLFLSRAFFSPSVAHKYRKGYF